MKILLQGTYIVIVEYTRLSRVVEEIPEVVSTLPDLDMPPEV